MAADIDQPAIDIDQPAIAMRQSRFWLTPLLVGSCFSLGYGISPLPTLAWHSEEQNLIRTYAELESRQAGTAARISDALKDERITRDELEGIYQELVDEHQAQVRLVMSAGILE